MLNSMLNMVSYVVCGVCEIEMSDPVVCDAPERVAPELVAFTYGLGDVDTLTHELNTLTSAVLARPVPLLTVDELCQMVELDTQIQKHR